MNDYDSVNIFGFPTYYHIRDSKLDPRAKKTLFLGFSTCMKGYYSGCLDSNKEVISCNVIFDELEMLKLKVQVPDSSFGTLQPVEFETSVVSQGVNEFESKVGEDGVVWVNLKLRLLVLHSDTNPLLQVDLGRISESTLGMRIWLPLR